MYCGEPDFPHLLKSISEQNVEIVHQIISYKSEIDAHNAVYQAFNSVGPDWIRAKIDADIVLNPGALALVAKSCGLGSWIDPQSHDYFTDAPLHAGMAFYGPNVRFRHQTNALKCDRNVAIGCKHQVIGVIAKHAHYADELTGFHYGFHRGLKSQLPVFDALRAAHRRHNDRVRLMAIRGFELAQSDRYKDYHLEKAPPPDVHNYGPSLNALFEEFKVDNPPKLERTWR
jgi:hypothetical protein